MNKFRRLENASYLSFIWCIILLVLGLTSLNKNELLASVGMFLAACLFALILART